MIPSEIRDEFNVHLLNEQGKEKAKKIAKKFSMFLNWLESPKVCGFAGREMAIVRTKLEEASFFAKKAMAIQKENQQ